MNGIPAELSERYLQEVAELRCSGPLYDTHVHPYEVLFDRFAYQQDPSLPGVLSMPGKCYLPPAAGPVKFGEVPELGTELRPQRLIDIAVMLLGRMYGSVGPRVFSDQLSRSGLDRVLLLPVAAEGSDAAQFELRMQWIRDLYGDDDRFSLAGSIPPTLEGDQIEGYAAHLKERFAIRAIKCHPVVSGINLGTSCRKTWLEALLEGCHRLGLPVVIHGGRNNPYWACARADFGSLTHLRQLNFSLSGSPVILAHAGMHRCPLTEMEREALPVLKKMLARHDNLYVDLSGLEFEQLKLVLASVAPERILFGSDALYTPQWEVVATTVHALHSLGAGWQQRFLQFSSTNPHKVFENVLLPADSDQKSRPPRETLTSFSSTPLPSP
ncbi:amidohydrolase family protein [Geomonas sp.]|uniref:amidohydrolase family protein n=1 Tax=Geomonas sp. TaxID=2651584 RepID=UPI002B49E173|nr:amidohydrolase family protein [Geomonas sp.]HJV34264.1 amidohydrolase family protein [Geomonas sp.]